MQQGRDERDRHAHRRGQVAPNRRPRSGEAAKPENEERERDDVQPVDDVRADCGYGDHQLSASAPPACSSCSPGGFSGLRLNISSIRSVTKNPPMMLIVPNMTATT